MARAFEPEIFNQLACFQRFRVAENAAAAGLGVGLGACAMAEVAVGAALSSSGSWPGVQPEPAEHHQVGPVAIGCGGS